MTPQQQKVRLHFLIALTLVVAAFGVTRLLRTYHQTRTRTDYVRTESELREYAKTMLRSEQEQLQDFALAEHGRTRRDAAALLMQARSLLEQGAGASMLGPAGAALAQVKANFLRLKAGGAVTFLQGIPFIRGYYVPADGSFQPYSICVPQDYTGERPYPLIITLEGRAGNGYSPRRDAPPYEGAISVLPGGGAATGYMRSGEDNMLAALEDVCALYEVDRGRVCLVGKSDGVLGAWNLAAHHPDRFVGLVVFGSGADTFLASPQAAAAGGPGTGFQDALAFLEASFSPVSYAENLRHSSIFVADTLAADASAAARTPAMVRRLRELGYPLEYLRFPQSSTGGFPEWVQQYALARVFGQESPSTPTAFRYRTASLRHDGAWWVRLERLDRPLSFAAVRTQVSDGRVEFATENVSALTVSSARMPEETSVIAVDGAQFALPKKGVGASLYLEKRAGAWQAGQPAGLLKRKGLSGPISDAVRDPFMVVYGTGGDSELLKRISHDEAARFAAAWQWVHGTTVRFKNDREVSDKDVEDFNLILFGGAQVNELSAKLAADLPVRVEGDSVVIAQDTYSGHDAGFVLCYPNPLNRRRLVVLVGGTTPAALYQAWDRIGTSFGGEAYCSYKWFDYAVFDNRAAGPESYLTVGFFDNEWQLCQAGGSPAGGGEAWKGQPDAAARVQPQGFPALERAVGSDQREVVLSDVMPSSIEQDCGAVGFDRTCAGSPVQFGTVVFQKGLGVGVPSAVSFALDGQFRQFRAVVGLTGGAEPVLGATARAEAIFEVWGDGRLLASSSPVTWGGAESSSATVSADVHQVSMLTLKVRSLSALTWPRTAGAWANPTVVR